MSTRTESTHQVTQIEVVMEASYTNFIHAFESLLGRMPVEAVRGLPYPSGQAAREQLASARLHVAAAVGAGSAAVRSVHEYLTFERR